MNSPFVFIHLQSSNILLLFIFFLFIGSWFTHVCSELIFPFPLSHCRCQSLILLLDLYQPHASKFPFNPRDSFSRFFFLNIGDQSPWHHLGLVRNIQSLNSNPIHLHFNKVLTIFSYREFIFIFSSLISYLILSV